MFNATNCTLLELHKSLQCLTVAGAGGELRWSVVVDGQASVNPTYRYREPVIFNMTGPGTVEASTKGTLCCVIRQICVVPLMLACVCAWAWLCNAGGELVILNGEVRTVLCVLWGGDCGAHSARCCRRAELWTPEPEVLAPSNLRQDGCRVHCCGVCGDHPALPDQVCVCVCVVCMCRHRHPWRSRCPAVLLLVVVMPAV